jgi:multidrug efflux system membrane fusion protein
VQRGEPGTYVYVINANNTVAVRPVKVGPTDGGYMAVLSGLQAGEKVVTDGTDRLRDGAPVIVPPPAQGQGKAADAAKGQGGGQGKPQGPGQAGQGKAGQGQPGQGEGHHRAQAASESGQAPAPAAPPGPPAAPQQQ